MLKQAVYFYKENTHNIPISIASYNDVKMVVFPSNEELEHISTKFPKAKGNLYVLVDGVTFKLNS